MSMEVLAELVSKYNDVPELFLTPDDASMTFVHSRMQNLCFDGAYGDPFPSCAEFMSALRKQTGLDVFNVDSRAGNCFFHAFWFAYYGNQPTRDDLSRLRLSVACRVFSKWSDPVFRSVVTVNPDYSKFVDQGSGVFDLSKFLAQVSDESLSNYQLEGDGMMSALVAEIFKCVIVIVLVKSEGSMTRMVVGETSDNEVSKCVVYVAWNGLERSAHYFAFIGNPNARVAKWAEIIPTAMYGDDVDVRDLTREGEVCV
jgi:hypothetical protein